MSLSLCRIRESSLTGLNVGLLGGSFDPPHAGHLHITDWALKRFALDQVWWLVSPGNPLKQNPSAPLTVRCDAARSLISHPRVRISDIESRLETTFTADTICVLQKLFPRTNFVWLMGADSLAGIHEWNRWHEIFERVAIGVLARRGHQMSARASVAARTYGACQLKQEASRILIHFDPPVWCVVDIPMHSLSSTELRNGGSRRCPRKRAKNYAVRIKGKLRQH